MPVEGDAGGGRRYAAASSFAPLRFGLASVAETPVEGDRHWMAGIEWQPDECGEARAIIPLCADADKSPSATGIPTLGAYPITIYAEIDCAVVGLTPDEMQTRTTRALTNGGPRALERVFWTGVAEGGTLNPHLAADAEVVESADSGFQVQVQSAADVVVTGAPVVEAFGLLEGALSSCYGGEGVIHVPARAAAHLAAHHLVIRDGERLRTSLLGHRVAVYAADSIVGPNGSDAPAGGAWFYATGAVSMRAGSISYTSAVRAAVDRAKNRYVHIAERTYVVSWDCCHLAAQASLAPS